MQRTDQQPPGFDAGLKRGLERRREPGGMECPGDITLAAYCERSLAPSESARWEAHFSDCARCQGMLAAIARAQSAVRVEVPRAAWRRWQPYAALAAGVAGISIAVSLMVTRHRQSAPIALSTLDQPGASARVAEGVPSKPETSGPQIALNAPAPQAKPEAGPPIEREATAPKVQLQTADQTRHPAEAKRAGTAEEGPRFASGFGVKQGLLGRFSQPKSAGEAAAPAIGSEIPQAPPAPPPPALAMTERRFAPASPGNVPVPALSSEAATAASAAPRVAMATGNGKAAIVSISTADGVERWRLGAEGMIQHLGTDGQWYRQISGVSNNLTAGAAPSRQVCWAVGTDGTVLLTTDGAHWHRLNSPTAENLVAVAAVDASSAIVTAADGQRFATADAGRNWRRI